MNNDEKSAPKKRLQLKKRSKKLKKHARRVEGATIRHARRFLVSRWDKIREIRLHIIMWLGGVGILIGLVGIQMIWFQQSYITEAPKAGGTYAEAIRGPIETLNPLFAKTPAEIAASHLLFSSLYTNDTTGHLRGDLAVSMNNENDQIFTVELRRDVKWHDGRKLTAADVKFTVDMMKNPQVRSVMMASWQGVEVEELGDYIVQFTLPAAYAAFPQALTFAVLPKHILESADKNALRESPYSIAPIGSGPFSLRLLQVMSSTSDRKVAHMDANKQYYLGSPRLDYLQLHTYADDENMVRALRTGEVNAVSNISSRAAETLDAKRFSTVVRPVNSGVYALLNLNSPALKDSNVRRALQMGTDTAQIRNQLFGKPQALHLPFIQEQAPGSEKLPAPVVDKEAAARLLDRSGWKMQGDVRTKGSDRLYLRVVTRKNSDYELVLRSLAGQWRQLGAQVDTVVVEPANFTADVLHNRNYDILVDELVIGGDPDVFAYWHSQGILNFTGYRNQTSDDALSSARTTSDPKLRSVKYVNFAKQWLRDAPAIGLYQSNLIYIHTPSTHAVGHDEIIITPDDHYAGVRYWTAENGKAYKTP